jgi:hypothetical protein
MEHLLAVAPGTLFLVGNQIVDVEEFTPTKGVAYPETGNATNAAILDQRCDSKTNSRALQSDTNNVVRLLEAWM